MDWTRLNACHPRASTVGQSGEHRRSPPSAITAWPVVRSGPVLWWLWKPRQFCAIFKRVWTLRVQMEADRTGYYSSSHVTSGPSWHDPQAHGGCSGSDSGPCSQHSSFASRHARASSLGERRTADSRRRVRVSVALSKKQTEPITTSD